MCVTLYGQQIKEAVGSMVESYVEVVCARNSQRNKYKRLAK